MDKNKEYFDKEKFREQLRKQLYEHRDNLKITQVNTAMLLGISPTAYQRWESTGHCLTNIYKLLNVFHVLKFSLTEIMKLLELPEPTEEELKEFYADTVVRESVKQEGIINYVRNNCTDMQDIQIEKLLDILFTERLKRRRH